MNRTLSTREMILCALFSALTAASALISIPLPFSPVPVTFQVFFVLLSGAILGSKLGAISQTVYILSGITGLPVFSRGMGGLVYLLGPTGGYIIGFPVCAYLTGLLFERINKPYGKKAIPIFLSGLLAIYVPGVIWLLLVSGLGIVKVILIGVVPFLPGDIVKIILAYGFINKYNNLLKVNKGMK